jgi:RNA polymerase sigma factor (sigma-70 family)
MVFVLAETGRPGVTIAPAAPNGDRMDPADATSLDDLLRAANRGDERAYAEFLRQVAPIVRGIARSRGAGLGSDVIEDIVQETLLAIHQKRHTWREDMALRPWLYAIVRYKVIDAFRARGRRVQVPIEDFAEVLPAEPVPDPTERHDAERVIGRLDPRSARIMRAIGLEGASIAEISAELGMTEVAVRVALHRGLKRLASLRAGLLE